ncbi:MAG: TetR family transcriptional regulator [Rubrivivax sp.]
MTEPRQPAITSRRKPKQARSNDLVAAILEAAVQVLAKEGARRFTTTRVAERAGVSVGSIYQYFPNKAAILFRLQSDEWRATSEMLARLLDDRRRPPRERLRRLVHAFLKSECEEAAIRGALDDAAPLYRDAPEALDTRAAGERALRAFVDEVMPQASEARRAMAAELITTTLSAVGKRVSETGRSQARVRAMGEEVVGMVWGYLGAQGDEANPMPESNGRR